MPHDKRFIKGQRGGEQHPWVVEFDPCDAPMARGKYLSATELDTGLRLGAFLDGMRFTRHGRRYVVQGGELVPFRRPA
jgi:hypothetical protein